MKEERCRGMGKCVLKENSEENGENDLETV